MDTNITFFHMDKTQKALWLPQMFDLMYKNMQSIIPDDTPYEQQKELFLSEVSPALEKAPRQVILCVRDDALVGFLQYYTRGDLLVIEEVQLHKAFQRSLTFYRLCRLLAAAVPADIAFIEAYTHKRNFHSQALLRKLGLKTTESGNVSNFLHFRGPARKAKSYFSDS